MRAVPARVLVLDPRRIKVSARRQNLFGKHHRLSILHGQHAPGDLFPMEAAHDQLCRHRHLAANDRNVKVVQSHFNGIRARDLRRICQCAFRRAPNRFHKPVVGIHLIGKMFVRLILLRQTLYRPGDRKTDAAVFRRIAGNPHRRALHRQRTNVGNAVYRLHADLRRSGQHAGNAAFRRNLSNFLVCGYEFHRAPFAGREDHLQRRRHILVDRQLIRRQTDTCWFIVHMYNAARGLSVVGRRRYRRSTASRARQYAVLHRNNRFVAARPA